MTESQWLACEPQNTMLLFLQGTASDRKCRLLACSFCRDMGQAINDGRYWGVVEAGERWADAGEEAVDTEEAYTTAMSLHDQAFAANDFDTSLPTLYALSCIESNPLHIFIKRDSVRTGWRKVLDVSLRVLDRLFAPMTERLKPIPDTRRWAGFICDIFGNPFRPMTFSPSWRTDTTLSLARQMYENRDFSAMPILADALQDADCVNDDILNHCRQPGEHVRGCWVVDLILGKS